MPKAAKSETESEAITPAVEVDDLLPSTGLLSFYDRLRDKIYRTVSRRGGKLGSLAANALLLVPDVFMLLARLSLDKDVPKKERAMIAGALAYFLLPMDLLPEMIVGGAGFADDLVLSVAVLAHSLTDLEPIAARHWSGPKELRTVIADVTGTARSLLGANLYGRVNKLLKKRGVEVA